MAIEETKENQKLHSLFMLIAFVIVAFDIIYFGSLIRDNENLFIKFLRGFSKMAFFKSVLSTKLSTFVILSLIGIGTVSKKNHELNILKSIVIPLVIGVLLMLCCIPIHNNFEGSSPLPFLPKYSFMQLLYCLFSVMGAIAYVVSIGNISKIIRSNFGKDIWNLEAESFMQEKKKIENDTSINIPTQFYYKKKVHDGYININPFRGVLIIGVPGSGKSFGLINPTIRQMIEKRFTMCIYDYKYPTLANIAYYRYLKEHSRDSNYSFKVLNPNNIKDSVRVNPIAAKYIKTLADAQETATCIVQALQKSEGSKGSEQFFSESAIRLLTAAIYTLAKYENGKYSDLPHLITLVCSDYKKLFDIIFSNREVFELLSTFHSSYQNKAFDQLEGQVGTLRVFLSKLASKENYYVFGEDELSLNITSPNNPTILLLASSPQTKDVNSTLFSVVVNRITQQANSPNNLPFGLVVDEAPTMYVHQIDSLVAEARSNKVAVILGIQELPQLVQQYGKENASKIRSVVANTFSGQAKHDDTLKWLETIFGKKKMQNESININRRDTSHSINEKMDAVIPQSRISQLATGEIVGMYARDIETKTAANWTTIVPPLVNCKINLDMKDIALEDANMRAIPEEREISDIEQFDEFLLLNMEKIRSDVEEMYLIYKTPEVEKPKKKSQNQAQTKR